VFSEERILTLAVLGREGGDGSPDLDEPAELAAR
jgi:hypothetical protein